MKDILLQNKPTTFEEGKNILVNIIQGMGTHLQEYQNKYVGNSNIKNLADRANDLYPYAEKYLQDYVGTRQFYIMLIALAQLCLKPFMENIEPCLINANRFFGSLELTAEVEKAFKEE